MRASKSAELGTPRPPGTLLTNQPLVFFSFDFSLKLLLTAALAVP